MQKQMPVDSEAEKGNKKEQIKMMDNEKKEGKFCMLTNAVDDLSS